MFFGLLAHVNVAEFEYFCEGFGERNDKRCRDGPFASQKKIFFKQFTKRKKKNRSLNT